MSKDVDSFDYLDRFLFEALPIRGERVLLEKSWQELLERSQYPKNVRQLLGDLIATTALLAATIKIEGKLTVQIQAKGVLDLMVVQVNHNHGLRAVARYQDEKALEGLDGLKALCGEGHIAITIDAPTFKEPYQGVIPLMDASISEAIERYFETSEQLSTKLYLATSDKTLSGILLQRLPGEAIDEDAFNRITQLAQTVTDEELLELDTRTLLYRLYSEDTIRLFEPDKYHFECSCSRERSLTMLYYLGKEEVLSVLKEEKGTLYVDCEFCGKRYSFDRSEIDLNEFKA